MNASTYLPPPELARVQQPSFILGAIGLGICAAGAFASPKQFFHSYLVAYVFWIGITLGCLALVMVQHLSGGAWGLVIRRVLESATRTLPLLALLFLPLALGLQELYIWARPDAVAAREILQHKKLYLNAPFFLVRAFIYFAVWMGVSYLLNKWSRDQDRIADPNLTRRMRAISGPGLVLYALTVTFAAIDWVMSLEPEWFSSIFGILFMGGQALSAMAFVIAVMVLLSRRPPLSEILAPEHLHDLGKLMLAFVMLWAYFSFSQFLIIWSGNLPEEIPWYIHRLHGGWQWIGLLLILFHFVLPFLLLLSRDLKRSRRRLAGVAGLVILMRFVDLFWLIAPEFNSNGMTFHWMDLTAVFGLGGVWVGTFARQLKGRPLLPINDPSLEEVVRHGRH